MDVFGGNIAASLLSSTSGVDSLLMNYYGAQLANLAAQAPGAAIAARAAPQDTVTVPPWDNSKDTKTDQQKLVDALQTGKFVTTSGQYFDSFSTPADQQKLFTAYMALSKLDALATDAAKDGTVAGALSGLDKKFQAGLSEVTSYLSAQTFDKFTLIQGQKLPTAKSTLAVPRNLEAKYVGNVVVNGSYDTPLALSGNQTFNVQVKKGGVTTTVSIDLSQVSGVPTLDNIAAFINQKLADNNIVSRVARNEVAQGQFGLVVKGVETETLKFVAPTGSPTLYVAGTSGSGNDVAGQLVRIDDDGTGGTQVFAERIAAVASTSSVKTTKPATATTAATTTQVDTSTPAPANAKSTAVDADGHVYVVGTTQGTLDGTKVQGTQDAYLTKYDSAGQVIWTKLLGASANGEGFAVATDSKGNVVIAGRADQPLTIGAVGGGQDAFVTKYNGDGEEIFTHELDPVADDGATSLAIGPDDSIYVGGYAKSAVTASVSYAGKGDATLTKLSANGTRLYAREFGTSESDTTRAVAMASDGNILVASVENDHAILRKFDSSNGASAALWSVDLGALQGGDIGAIAVDGSAVYVGGSTSNAALNAGGAASIANPASGGKDGFVTRIDDNGASASPAFTSYIGSGAADTVRGLTASNGAVYVTGDTQGALPGQTQSGGVNAFVARLTNSGTLDWTQQYGGRGGVATGSAIAIDPHGKSVLDQLGLPTGTFDFSASQLLTAHSTLRAGDSFAISIDSKPPRTITIAKDETIQSLKTKLNTILLQTGKSSSSYSKQGYQLQVTAGPGHNIAFIAGKDGFDALKGLGIRAGVIVNESQTDKTADTPSSTIAPADLTPKNNFVALGVDPSVSLSTKDSAKKAQTQIDSAMRNIRLAYTTLTQGKFIAGTGKYAQAQSSGSGSAPAYLQAQLANYAAGLQWLQGSSSNSTSFLGIG